jgi:predicted Zn-dependent protease
MLRKVILLSTIYLLSTLFGCVTEYNIVTQRQEQIFYDTDREVKMGRAILKEIEKKYKFFDDPLWKEKVSAIGKRLVEFCDRKDLNYEFYILDEDEINAFALPGGFIFVYRGLLEMIDSDDQLACVLGHEIGHIVAKHAIKKLQAQMGYTLIRIIASTIPENVQMGREMDLAFEQILSGFSREDEFLADRLGVRYAKRAGFSPHRYLEFLEKLHRIELKSPPRLKSYIKTHPYIPDRIRVVKEEIGEKISFTDYINIEERPR